MQFCPVARALDVIGERWTLLVVRELLWGPKRYTDLAAGLPGIAPNVLAERLRTLESFGLVAKRRLEPPAASTVYELTDVGEGLRPVVMELFQWGLRLVGGSSDTDAVRASYWLPAIEAAAEHATIAAHVDDVYEFRIAEETITVMVAAGKAIARQGSASAPDLVVYADHETFAALGTGRLSPLDAINAGRLLVEGDPEAARRCGMIFEPAQPADEPLAVNR